MAVLQPGTKLKRGTFEIVSLLGSGAFGEVYLARQPRVERDVAIKVLRSHLGQNEDVVMRFQREAFATARLMHPNVLTVFDFDFDEDTEAWFLAMQYVAGGRTLRAVLGSPLSLSDTVRLIEGVASGLDAAHSHGIVHRDIKPENIMLEGERALLTDFGVAHLTSLTGLTAIGVAVGTPAYMSPEQAMGQQVGPKSDQYALAVMVYEMLAGRPPFMGEPITLMLQHTNATPPSLTSFNPVIGAAARSAVALALSKNPDDRFSSCLEFVESLRVAIPRTGSGFESTSQPRAMISHDVAPTPPIPPASFPGPTSIQPRDSAPPQQRPSDYAPVADETIVRSTGAPSRQPSADWIYEHPSESAQEQAPEPPTHPPTEATSDQVHAAPTIMRQPPAISPGAATQMTPAEPLSEPTASPTVIRQGFPAQPTVIREGPTAAEPGFTPPPVGAPTPGTGGVPGQSVAQVPARGGRESSSGSVWRDRRTLLIGVAALALIGIVGVAGALIAGRGMTDPQNGPRSVVPVIAVASPVPTLPAVQTPAQSVATAAAAPGGETSVARGSVRVSSVPEGAAVLVNGEAAGLTPRMLTLNPGEHTVVVSAQSFEDWTQQINVRDGSQAAIEANLVPLPALKAIEIGQARIGRDAYMDPAGTIRLGVLTDSFTVADDVNAIVYLKPKSYRIRDLSFTARTRWQRAGPGGPLDLQQQQDVSRDWEETFVRACAPASAIDPNGSNTPLNLEIFIDGESVAQFTFRIGPGNRGAAATNPCDPSSLPSRIAFNVTHLLE